MTTEPNKGDIVETKPIESAKRPRSCFGPKTEPTTRGGQTNAAMPQKVNAWN